MIEEPKYRIVTNANRRKILEIIDVVEVDHTPELSFEDFDAIFINVMSPLMDRNMLAIRLASPLLSEKCRFKPCYVTQRLMGWLGKAEVIVDGYASQPTDNSMARGIEDIYSNMRQLNFFAWHRTRRDSCGRNSKALPLCDLPQAIHFFVRAYTRTEFRLYGFVLLYDME